jgi:hypothetical protein
MMADTSFFALLFLIAQSLAPDARTTLVLENLNHPEQRMEWTRGSGGSWSMRINGREVGSFERAGAEIVHRTSPEDVRRFPIGELADAGDLSRTATRIELRGNFARTVLEVRRERGAPVVSDPGRALLLAPLRLIAR